MKTSILIFISCLSWSTLFAQNKFLKNAEKEIMALIEKQRTSLPEKEIIKIFETNFQFEEVVCNSEDIIFSYIKGPTLRFYMVSENIDAQIQLWQRKDGIKKNEKEKLLWKVDNRGDESKITFYDYKLEKENDFLLEFHPVNNVKKGNAMLIVVEISKGEHQFFFGDEPL